MSIFLSPSFRIYAFHYADHAFILFSLCLSHSTRLRIGLESSSLQAVFLKRGLPSRSIKDDLLKDDKIPCRTVRTLAAKSDHSTISFRIIAYVVIVVFTMAVLV